MCREREEWKGQVAEKGGRERRKGRLSLKASVAVRGTRGAD
jgi:hypothetical protein